MSDQLRERFDALRNAAEHSDAGGLPDVRARRTRRTRTRVAAGTALAVAAIALGGVVVLPQLGDDRATSADDAAVANDAEGGSRASEPTTAQDEVAAEQPPTDTTPSEATPSEPTGEVSVPVGPFTLTAGALLTWEDIQALGETGPGTMPYEAALVFPPLSCAGAQSSASEYSDPVQSFSAVWTVADATLNQSVIQYESDQRATDALARLVQESQACPVFNEFGSIQFVSSDASIGAEIAFFDLQQESGQDGSIHTTVLSVTRIANVLVEVALVPDGQSVAQADSRSRALSQASVDRIVAVG
ncbi:MAG: sensor domain-containing protein [Geodermatophilaceae bacterium]|nr:sensor domain-containing protein [Geodermatophilaceae bacterium]